MYSAKKGFILTDALMSVMIAAVSCLLISSVIYSHYNTEKLIEEACSEQEEKNEQAAAGSERCSSACEETAEPEP